MKWISVKERLPESSKTKYVLTWIGDYLNPFFWVGNFYDHEKGKWYYCNERVTHWMEIEPPNKR